MGKVASFLLLIAVFTFAQVIEVDQEKRQPCYEESSISRYRLVIECDSFYEYYDLFDSYNVPSYCRQGVRGDKGPTGEAGRSGYPGANGVQGPEGSAGPIGNQGPSGSQGPQGPQGVQGLAGPRGPTGIVGPTGPEGPEGAQGPTGPQGIEGLPGLAGPLGPEIDADLNTFGYLLTIPALSILDILDLEVTLLSVTVTITALYAVTFALNLILDGLISLAVNGVILPTATFDVGTNQGFAVIALNAGDTVSVVLTIDAISITLSADLNISLILEEFASI